ncbi:MAG: winged helix-turn-helix transcriptional regulator, partial [Dialister invisus]|nr:winged helix-turn-helix transcriptional regulator [Dialister invisus]
MENGVKEKAYMALYARVREAITGGIYRWGGKLPSKRAMAERYGVSVITVEHAYALLAEEGYVEPRERSGYFIIYKEEDAFPVGYRGKEVKPVLHSETDEE